MATHSSILAGKIPWTEEPGWPQSMESQESETTGQARIYNGTGRSAASDSLAARVNSRSLELSCDSKLGDPHYKR